MKRKLLVIGDSYVSIQMGVPGATKTQGTVYGEGYSMYPSGSAAISAIAAAKSGADCSFFTNLGNDFYGDMIYEFYRSCHLPLTYIKKLENVQTGFEFVSYDGVSKSTFITKGANSMLSKKDIDEAFATTPDLFLIPQDYIPVNRQIDKGYSEDKFEDSRIDIEIGNVADYETVTEPKTSKPENLALYAMNKALAEGVELCVEYNENTALLPLEKVTNGIKIVVITDEMLKKVTGTAPISIEKTLSALISFSSHIKAKYYVVLKGNDTSFIYDGTHFEIAQTPAVVKQLSHNSMDPMMHASYTGAMIAEYNDTKDILRACKYAQVVSILTGANMGLINHIPSRHSVEQFLEKCGLSIDKL